MEVHIDAKNGKVKAQKKAENKVYKYFLKSALQNVIITPYYAL